MKRPSLALAAGALLVLGTSCNMSRHRYDVTAHGPDESALMYVWVNDEHGFTMHHLLFDTVLFPVDAVWSIGASSVAMFDPTWETQYGPLGTFLALFPCITTVNVTGPGCQRWDGSVNPPKVDFEGTLNQAQYENLIQAVEIGKGPPELQDLSNKAILRAGPASNPNRVDRLDLIERR